MRTAPSAKPAKSSLRENVESLIWAIAVAMAIRTFIVAPFKIPSGSMRPTLIEGDRIFVNRFLYRFQEPTPGDVIVFRFPENPKRPFIKRLVAKGGDRVEIRDGRLLINGQPPVSEALREHTQYYNQGPYGQAHEETQVPEGMYFVLGDNSASSHDSRFWGFVPKKLLIGKAMCIFWPPMRIRVLR